MPRLERAIADLVLKLQSFSLTAALSGAGVGGGAMSTFVKATSFEMGDIGDAFSELANEMLRPIKSAWPRLLLTCSVSMSLGF